MKLECLFLSLGLGLALAGCSKKEPAPSDEAGSQTPESSAVQAPDSASAPSAPAEPAAPDSAAQRPRAARPAPAVRTEADVLQGSVHQFMTAQLQIFIREKGRMPKDFSEFAAARMDSVPRAPEGAEWAIDFNNKQVILLKRK